MNMTDEILNSWTDADNYLADRIEADEEKIGSIDSKIDSKIFQIDNGSGGVTNQCVLSFPKNGTYIVVTVASKNTTERYPGSMYILFKVNNTLQVSPVYENSYSKVTSFTVDSGVLTINYANNYYHATYAINLGF